MEPAIREFFRRLSLSIGLGIIWMGINITIGIKFGFAFFEGNIHWGNIVFYIWLAASFGALVFLIAKIWKKPIEDLEDR